MQENDFRLWNCHNFFLNNVTHARKEKEREYRETDLLSVRQSWLYLWKSGL